MSFKQYLVMLCIIIGYLNMGAYMFLSIERPAEEVRRQLARAEALEIRALLRRHYAKGLPQAHMELLHRLSDYCGKPFFIDSISVDTNETDTDVPPDPDPEIDPYENKPYAWTFYNAFLFVMITLSTIGYGNLTPSTRQGRMLDVLYALFGIPFMGIVVTQMAGYFGKLFMRAHHRYKKHEYQTRLSLFADILTYSALGVVIFIAFPASIFVYFEEWTFDTGVYYAFVTLATIGYGDLVAGQRPIDTWPYTIYKLMILVWIMFGLGYMVMIVGFLTRVMRSKKVRRIEHKLANTIKATQSKIWNEFSQDVTYLRRMLNEMYLLKIQPVYVEKETEDGKGVRRVTSCPNLSEWPVPIKKRTESDSSSEDDEEMAANFRRIAMQRRKGNAENVMEVRIKRTVSEGDLSRIDRKATFGEDSGAVDPTLLLAKVVDALGTSVGSKFSLSDDEDEPPPRSRKISTKVSANGIHGFSDDEILASERPPSRWSLGGRKQAASAYASKRQSMMSINESNTWGGVNPADVHKFIMMRTNGELRRQSQVFDTESIASTKSSSSTHSLKPPPSRMRRMSMAVTGLFSHTNKNKTQDQKDQKEVNESTKKRRTGNTPGMLPTVNSNKRLSLPHGEDEPETMYEQANYLSHSGGRRGSVFAALANELGPKTNAAGGGGMSNVPVSPVLEQTSVADFLRLLSSLQAKLDPALSLPLETQNTQQSQTSRRKSMANTTGDGLSNPLSMLFSTPAPPSVLQPTSGPANLPHQGNRRVSIARTPTFLEAKGQRGRRFSLIPPMDVDRPSGQTNRRDILKLKKRSTSSQNMLNQSDGSSINISNLTHRQRPQRTSISGTAKYISSKLQSSSDAQKSEPPSSGLSQGFRKFSVRPVSAPEPSDIKPYVPKPIQKLPTITVESVDNESTTAENEDEDLQDVVVVRL